MAWKTFDFNTGTELNRSFLERLNTYIEKRESQIALEALSALERAVKKAGEASHSFSFMGQLRSFQGAQLFKQKVEERVFKKDGEVSSENINTLTTELNAILWEHVEFLEGAITELSSQVERIDLRTWSHSVMENVKGIKDLLCNALNDMETTINEFNAALNRLCDLTHSHTWSIKKMFHGTALDSELGASIRKSRSALFNEYERFTKVFENFSSMKEEIASSVVKIGTLPIFSTLDSAERELFLELFQLLKCYEKNKKTNVIDEKDLLMSLRRMMSKEKAFTVFRDYYLALYKELFKQSLEIKNNSPLSAIEEARKHTAEYLRDVQSEVVFLGNTMDHYREFLLSTDPNPYVRARMGFSEWVLGPESAESKQLHKSSYNIETLNRLFVQFIESVEKDPFYSVGKEKELYEKIEKLLHEMAAPLLSERLMHKGVEELVSYFEEANELGSLDPKIVPQMGVWLGRALRSDSRYHILHRYPEFHEIYAIHLSLASSSDDKLHRIRLNKFKKMIGEIKRWVAERETALHSRDIELDINDIRGYLQEFFAHIQQVSSSEGGSKSGEAFALQLLEYRYLFGQFFHELNKDNTEENLIYSRFYFVDQYFDAIDKKLGE